MSVIQKGNERAEYMLYSTHTFMYLQVIEET